MKPIKHPYLQSNKNYFIYVAPAPSGKTYEQILADPERSFMANNITYQARLFDALIYPLDKMSEFHCRWAYGFSTEKMQSHLKSTWKELSPASKIAFYLFEIIS